MREATHPRQRQLVRDTLGSPRGANRLTTVRFSVGGKPMRAFELSDSFAVGEPGMLLDATVPGNYGEELYGADTELQIIVNGVSHPGFLGEIVGVKPDGSNTKLQAVTADYYADGEGAIWLGERTAYTDRRPSDVAHEVSAQLPYRAIAIPIVQSPKFTRSGGDSFAPTATVGEVREAIKEDSGLFCYGDELNRCRGILEEDLEEPGKPVVFYKPGVHFRQKDGFEADLKDENRYRDVVIYRDLGDGEIEVLARQAVKYRSDVKRPPEGADLRIATEDPDRGVARSTALKTSRAASLGVHTFSLTTVFIDPRIERGDTLMWITRSQDILGNVRMLTWRGVVGGRNRTFRGGPKGASYSGTARVHEIEELGATRRRRTRAFSVGVV